MKLEMIGTDLSEQDHNTPRYLAPPWYRRWWYRLWKKPMPQRRVTLEARNNEVVVVNSAGVKVAYPATDAPRPLLTDCECCMPGCEGGVLKIENHGARCTRCETRYHIYFGDLTLVAPMCEHCGYWVIFDKENIFRMTLEETGETPDAL